MEEIERQLALAQGVSSAHLLRAALHVARLVDAEGSRVGAVHHGYRLYGTDGRYPPEDMQQAESLLVAGGLLERQADVLLPGEQVRVLSGLRPDQAEEALIAALLVQAIAADNRGGAELSAAEDGALTELVPEPERREAILLSLAQTFDSTRREEVGQEGELLATEMLRKELSDLGRGDLADQVQQVSAISDQLGYDVTAPRLNETPRRIEVKTCSRLDDAVARFFLSRNEATVGRRDENWSLLICAPDEDEALAVLGWTTGPSLVRFLPEDQPGSHWQSVEVRLPVSALDEGVPPAV